MTTKTFLTLCFIFILGLFLRVAGLGHIPRGFTPDEASQAYTAYSLLRTSHDEWGVSWPLSSFRSFLDYKSSLQTYLMIPSIKFFGLNEFSARLPSAIFGSLAILSSFYLVLVLVKSPQVALITAFLLATSPWAIQFSRMALEANLAVFFITSGLLFLLVSFERPFALYVSSVFFSVSLYSYHAAKLFVPLFLLCLFFVFQEKLKKNIKVLIGSLFLAFFLVSPLVFNLTAGDSKRGSDLLISNISKDRLMVLNDTIFYSPLYQVNPIIPRLFHNKITLIINDFTENYLSYFSPHFWFLEGGREITYSIIPGRGLLLFVLFPFTIFGLIKLLKSNLPQSHKVLIFLWLILAPLPAALTKEGYRPNRAISFMFLLEFLSAFGIYSFICVEKPRKILKSAILITIFLLSFIFYLEDYIFSSFVKFPDSMSYGWRDAVSYLSSTDKNYQTVFIQQGGQPQSMIAFYKKIDPVIFQTASQDWSRKISQNADIKYLDQLGLYSLQKYTFKSFAWPEDISTNRLYLAKELGHLPSSRRTLKQITSPQGQILFEIFDFPKP